MHIGSVQLDIGLAIRYPWAPGLDVAQALGPEQEQGSALEPGSGQALAKVLDSLMVLGLGPSPVLARDFG